MIFITGGYNMVAICNARTAMTISMPTWLALFSLVLAYLMPEIQKFRLDTVDSTIRWTLYFKVFNLKSSLNISS